jgi:succinylarginine dihydrolase
MTSIKKMIGNLSTKLDCFELHDITLSTNDIPDCFNYYFNSKTINEKHDLSISLLIPQE